MVTTDNPSPHTPAIGLGYVGKSLHHHCCDDEDCDVWLEPADVARLDIAYNNRALSRVLRGLLCSPLTLFDVSYSTSYAKLKWAMKRRLHLGSILISSFPNIPEEVRTSIVLTTCLGREVQL
jgi:hypothetical protein